MWDIVVKKFTFAISSPDEFLFCLLRRRLALTLGVPRSPVAVDPGIAGTCSMSSVDLGRQYRSPVLPRATHLPPPSPAQSACVEHSSKSFSFTQ